MTGFRGRVLLLLLSTAIVVVDVESGPYIMFPILFVVPVALGAWYHSAAAGVSQAVMLVGSRLFIAIVLEPDLMPAWAAAVNAGIRLVVLVGFAVLVARVARQERLLATRVRVLEGILPICSFCKKIRLPDGLWEPIERYVSKRSDAAFSHGFCEACGREHYGELYDDGEAVTSGQTSPENVDPH